MHYGIVFYEPVYHLIEEVAALTAYEFDGAPEPALDILI